jgi:hypothetical protein
LQQDDEEDKIGDKTKMVQEEEDTKNIKQHGVPIEQ